MNDRRRLDQLLTERHGYASRSRARDAILRGCVQVAGVPAGKPGQMVDAADDIVIDDPAALYVCRAALKLKYALQATGLSLRGLIGLDLGASTGGFTQVLLEYGVRRVIAIDAGEDQLDETLRADRRVTAIESTNVRFLSDDHLDGMRPQFITADLSFISLKLALPPALELAAPGAVGIFLVKPQFEVGRKNIGKSGIVRSAAIAHEAAAGIRDWLDKQPDWRVTHFLASPITGGDGNKEFLLAARKARSPG